MLMASILRNADEAVQNLNRLVYCSYLILKKSQKPFPSDINWSCVLSSTVHAWMVFFNCIYVYFNLPTSRQYIYHEQIVLIKYAALTPVCIYQFVVIVVVIVVAFCHLQIRLLYCLHVGMDNLFKQIFENKFWKLLKYSKTFWHLLYSSRRLKKMVY